MEKIINEVTEKLNRELNEFFTSRPADVGSAERYFGSRIAEAVLELLRAYYEKSDQELLEDKAGRKQAGLTDAVRAIGIRTNVLQESQRRV